MVRLKALTASIRIRPSSPWRNLLRKPEPGLQQATTEFLNSLGAGNETCVSGAGCNGLPLPAVPIDHDTLNVNEATGEAEAITVITTQLRNGQILYDSRCSQ